MSATAVAMNNVTVHYHTTSNHEVTALNNITLAIDYQKWVSIAGPSGSGKSSLLHVIGGLLTPQSGEIIVDQTPLHTTNQQMRATFRLTHIGFVFQSFYLMPHLRAWENVALPMLAAHIPLPERKKRAIEALARVGLQDRLYHRPAELSGGEQQRVALARAVALAPRIILADEPTGNLDADSATVVLDILTQFVAQGATVICATHDPLVIARGDAVIHLHRGVIVPE